MYHLTIATVQGLHGVLLQHAVKVSLLLAQLHHTAMIQLRQILVGHLWLFTLMLCASTNMFNGIV